MKAVGVDGCRGGWLAIVYDVKRQSLTPDVHSSFADLVEAYADATSIAVDIPIGLATGKPRRCDIEARKVLGARRSSVFPAPDPRIINARSYVEASGLSRSLTGKGVSQQSFAIYPKVAEVNAVVTPELQDQIIEVHPEVSFWAVAGQQPMTYSKRKPEGFNERRALLMSALDGISIPDRQEARQLVRPASADDVLDAIVAAWTAHRHATGNAGRLPDDPDIDGHGLRMEIVY